MTISFRPAKRERVYILAGLAGASGSGKTFSALRLARGLAGDSPFAYIDSEARRALHYADQYQPWHHAELSPPFRPQTYLDAIHAAEAEGFGVIVVDSVSHEYSGRGGLLDWKEEILDKRAGDDAAKRERLSVGAWNAPKTAHARFVSELLQVRAHLILAFRARQAIEMAKEENGKTVVRPTKALDSFEGWLIETEHTRAPLAFELTCSFLMLPDSPGVPRPIKLPEPLRPFVPLNKPLSEETGEALAKWAAGSASMPARKSESEAKKLTTELLEIADSMGKKDEVSAAIARHRGGHSAQPAQHVTWLRAQIKRAREASEALAGVGAEAGV